ncbi:MAG: DUF1735 domain-containing protein [Bacteroidota bacterium]|nr:DUF1735 domain-containing protein [Bacteroidota bacterium]MDP4291493.1 DUF1735 domain-containing protein [Bacteroidota bacterium]
MKNKILIIITFLAGTMLFNSCLKDKLNTDWTSALKGKMYAEFVNYGLTSSTINNLPADQTVRAFVNIATDALPTSDITVTVTISQSALDAYNVTAKQNWVAAGNDASTYVPLVMCPNISVNPVVIKKGTRNGYAYITLKHADQLSLTTAYAIPLQITAVSNNVMIAANKQSTIIQVPVANKWEGSYDLSYYILRAGDNVLSGNVRHMAWKLGTSGAKSVTYWKTHLWGDGKSSVGGISAWQITIDDSTVPNKISVIDPQYPAVTMNTAYPNRYDPATKTFYLSVYWGTGPTNRAATDTLVYSGSY